MSGGRGHEPPCTVFRRGHQPHHIQYFKAAREQDRHRTGHVRSVTGTTIEVVLDDGEVVRLANHDPRRVRAAIATTTAVRWSAAWGILVVGDAGTSPVVSVASVDGYVPCGQARPSGAVVAVPDDTDEATAKQRVVAQLLDALTGDGS